VELDPIVRNAQTTINQLSDNLKEEVKRSEVLGSSSTIVINMMGSIDIQIFLRRRGELLLDCLFQPIKAMGIETLGELLEEIEHTMDVNKLALLRQIEKGFPTEITEAVKYYSNKLNEKVGMSHIYLGNDKFVSLEDIQVSQIQTLLKHIVSKIETPDYNRKLDIESFEMENLVKVRKNVPNVTLRNIFYRLINKDFFTRERMARYKMVDSDRCTNCEEVKTFKHLMWECNHVRITWINLNSVLVERGLEKECVHDYSNIYDYGVYAATSTIKLKIIKALIQIDRRTKLGVGEILKIINDLINKEKYIAVKKNKQMIFKQKWKDFLK